MVSPLPIVALVLAVAAFALSITQATLKEFVKVFIVEDATDPKNPKLSCSIAGLAVYETSYDSSCLSENTLAQSRVPAESFTAPTTEFKLLFPAQQNFVAEVLPVNEEILQQIADAVGDAAADAVRPFVEDINNLEFENCAQYMGDAQVALTALFQTFNLGFIPQLVGLLSGSIVEQVGAGLTALNGGLSAALPNNVLFGTLATTFTMAQAAIDNACGESMAITTSQPVSGCVATGLNAFAGALPPLEDLAAAGGFIQILAGFMGSNCVAGSAFACFSQVSTVVTDNGLFAPAAISGGAVDYCTGLFAGLTCDASTRLAFGGFMAVVTKSLATAAFATESPTEAETFAGFATGFGTLAATGLLFTPELALAASSQTAGIINTLETLDATLPSTFTERYAPCGLLMIADLSDDVDLPSIPDFNLTVTECSFEVYLSGAAELAAAVPENAALAPVIAQLAFLYNACAAFGLGPSSCGTFFPALFMNGAYSGEMDDALAVVAGPAGPNGVFAAGVAACEDDETDLEKISLAQIIFGVAIGAYGVAMILDGVSLGVPAAAGPLLIVGGVLSLLGLGLNLGALLIVQSAPVYDAVGEDAVAFTPYYEEGLVSVLALVTFIVTAAAAVASFTSAYLEMKKGASLEDLEVKDETAALAAAAKEDP